jgi:tol-pal system protein YbgF
MQGPPASLDDVAKLQQRVDNMNKRLGTNEEAVAQSTKLSNETDRANRQARTDQSVLIEDLRTELKSLRNDMELIQYDAKKSEETQKKFKEDLDLRMSDLERNPAGSVAASPPPPAAGVSKPPKTGDAEGEMLRYNQIHTLLGRRDFDQAIAQYQEFLKEYPEGRYAPAAQYWLAEARYSKRDFSGAITEFQKVIDRYPQSDKVCDSRLKQGFAFLELKDPAKAKLFLGETRDRCKGKPAGTKAQRRLAELAASPAKK